MTFVTFVEAVAGLTVTGVKRYGLAPPQQLNAGDLPYMFPRIPQQDVVYNTFSSGTGHTGVVELAIVVAPDGVSTRAAAFADACALVDALDTALQTLAVVDSWAIRQTAESYDGGATGYTVLVATVEGSW